MYAANLSEKHTVTSSSCYAPGCANGWGGLPRTG